MKTLKTGDQFEILGMVLLLASSTWTLFFSDTLAYLLQDSYFYRIDEKLDAIWFTLADFYSHSEANDSGAYIDANFKSFLENWKEWRQGQETIRAQGALHSKICAFFFVCGSGLLIAGKYSNAKRN